MFKYFADVQAEMKHVSWPTRQQSLMYTLMVLLVSFVTASYLGTLDYIFAAILKLVI